MPCFGPDSLPGGGIDPSAYGRVIKQREQFEAILCGICSVFKPDELENHLDGVNWKEVGLSRRFFELWWREHKEKDALRLLREKAELKKQKEKQKALDKLTPQEKKILGLC